MSRQEDEDRKKRLWEAAERVLKEENRRLEEERRRQQEEERRLQEQRQREEERRRQEERHRQEEFRREEERRREEQRRREEERHQLERAAFFRGKDAGIELGRNLERRSLSGPAPKYHASDYDPIDRLYQGWPSESDTSSNSSGAGTPQKKKK